MQVIRPSSWSELQDVLYEDAWNASLRRFRSPFAYRGVSDARYSLRTSLTRLGGDPRALERHLLRAFRRYAYTSVRERESYWHWLALGQHHGLPTRLLDWSYSPLVALHFATASIDKFDCDGVVWMANLSRANAALPPPLARHLAEDGTDVFTVESLASFSRRHARERDPDAMTFDVQVLEDLERTSDQPFLLFFEPPSIDERIVQQYALFSLLSNPVTALEGWLGDHEDVARQVVLSADLKWEVRDKLDQANINERTLFPGLTGLSTWLKRYYLPREAPDEEPKEDEARDANET